MVCSLFFLSVFLFFPGCAFLQAQDAFIASPSSGNLVTLPAPKESSKHAPKRDIRTILKVVGGVVVPMFVIGECLMYTNFIKATYQWLTHGKEVRSFFAKPPAGATYSLKVTIKRFWSSKTHSFTSTNPRALIQKADSFTTEFIKKEYPNDLLVRILLEPAITTKQGRKIVLNPFYSLWNAKEGIAPELYRKFFSAANSNADQVFEALQSFTIGSLMTLTAPLLVAAAYRLQGALFATPLTL